MTRVVAPRWWRDRTFGSGWPATRSLWWPPASTPNRSKGHGDGNGHHKVRIQAPLQAVDPAALTVQVLGLSVDISTASVEGADDDDCGQSTLSARVRGHDEGGDEGDEGDDQDGDDEGCMPVDVSELMPGQFVQIKLNPDSLPTLVATQIEVKNFTNGILVQVVRARGRSASGPVQVSVMDSVRVRDASGHLVTRRLSFQAIGSGRILIQGLPTGQARVTVRRLSSGARATVQRVPVMANRVRTVRVPLR